MFLTHTNSVYSEDLTLLKNISRPQYTHQVSDGGMAVQRGIKIMPAELIEYVLRGRYGALDTTPAFIKELTQLEHCKVGLILASGGNIWTGYLPDMPRSAEYPTHKMITLGMTQIHAGGLANKLGTFDYISTDSTSCISGHAAWYTAKNMMALGILDAVVVVSSDNGTSEEYLEIFGKHGLSKLAAEEGNPNVRKFRLGQGCNISVFESTTSVAITGNTPIAKITDMHIASESFPNPLGISPTGAGYAKVIEAVDAWGIDFVKTHSTFSEDNKVEEQVIKELLGDVPTINYKLRIGHTMGASTAVETALAIQEESGKFLSLGAGMGNVFSSAVVEIL